MADPPNTQSYTQFQHNTAYVPASCLVTWCDWTINPNDTWHSLSWAKNQAYQATVAAAGASRQKRKWFCLEFWGCWLRFRSCLALRWKRCSRNLDAFSQRQSAMLWLCFLSAPAGAKTADKVSNIFQLQIPKAGTENNGFGSWTARPTVQSVHVFPSTVPHKEPRAQNPLFGPHSDGANQTFGHVAHWWQTKTPHRSSYSLTLHTGWTFKAQVRWLRWLGILGLLLEL